MAFSDQRLIDQQLRQNDCGISAVKIVCNILGVPISREYIKAHVHMNEEGSSLASLKRFFAEQGFEAHFHILDVNSVAEVEHSLTGRLPCIVLVKKEGGLHYVVINDFSGGRFKVLDPADSQSCKWTLAELRNNIYMADSTIALVELREKIQFLVTRELRRVGLSLEASVTDERLIMLYNKLTYFTYLSEHFGFKDAEAERAFLRDLIENQDFSSVPRHFNSLLLDKDVLKIKAPVVLSVRLSEEKPVVSKENQKSQSIYARLVKMIGGVRNLWFIFLFTSVLAAIVTHLAVFINQILIDEVLPKFQLNILALFALGVALFKLFELVVGLYTRYVGIHLANALDKYFIAYFDRNLSHQSVTYLAAFKKGDLIERISDSMKIKSFFLYFFSDIFVDVIISITSIFILMMINLRISLVVLGTLFCFAGIFFGLVPKLRQLEQQRFIKKADLFSKLVEKIEGLEVIRSFNLEDPSSREIAVRSHGYIEVQTKGRYLGMWNVALSSITVTAATLVILVLCSRELMLHSTMTLGQLVTFIALSAKIFSSFQSLLEGNLDLQEHRVILQRFYDFEEQAKPKVQAEPSTQQIQVEQVSRHVHADGIRDFQIDRFEARDLAYEYGPDKPVLQSADLDIRRGEKMLIYGRNGSGKSTLSKILGLLYEPARGHMTINGLDLSLYDRRVLRRKVLLVTGDDLLFNDTLLFNITFGREVEMEHLIRYAREVGFYDYIVEHPDRLRRLIYENGRNLSTGQKRKIILLRALFSKAELIIFDEVFRGLDPESQYSIERVLNQMKDRTMIFISHDPFKCLTVDRQYYIEAGRLQEVECDGHPTERSAAPVGLD